MSLSKQFVTLSKNDPQFYPILSGSFSTSQIALPLESLNISTENESVTFEIKNRKEIVKPNLLKFLFLLLRFENLPTVLVPALAVAYEAQDPLKVLQIAFAVSFLLLAANLRNDVQDHIRGFDRANTRTGSRVIQNGWIAAGEVQKLSWCFFLGASLLGLPVLWSAPGWFVLFCFVSMAILLGLSSRESKLRFSLLSEFSTFLISGPLLTAATSFALYNEIRMDFVKLGVLWGAWYAVVTQFRSFRQIMLLSEAKMDGWMVRVGFDNSKRILLFLYCAGCLMLTAYSFLITGGLDNLYWSFAVVALANLLFGFGVIKELSNLKSPLGSGIYRMNALISKQHLTIALILLLVEVIKIFKL